MAEEYVEWIKLPHDLQAKFFKEAEREAERIIKRIDEIQGELDKLKPLLEKNFRKLGRLCEAKIISAVDSSRSPVLSERLGIRYGVFATARLKIRGLKRLGEEYEAGLFKRRQTFSRDKSRAFFSLLATYAERKMAVEALDDSDLVLVDGSFYGFIYEALRMKKQGLYGDEERKILEETFRLTDKLVRSGKALGVIKRSHSRIIGGWLALKGEYSNPYTMTLDKLILAHLMPARTLLNYGDLTGYRYPPLFYTALSRAASLTQRGDRDLLKEALDRVYQPFKSFKLSTSNFNNLSRLQVKPFPHVPPCEIEYHRSIPLSRIEEWLSQENFFNEITGLPTAIDLVDNLVNIPSRFTEEFVAEVEARVIEKLRGRNIEMIQLFFEFLNPQKPY